MPPDFNDKRSGAYFEHVPEKLFDFSGKTHAPNIDLRTRLSARPEAGPEHARHLLAVSGAISIMLMGLDPKSSLDLH